jgi:hypothetical protein
MQPRLTSLISLLAFTFLATPFAHALVIPQQLDISGPVGSTAFGKTVKVLPNGNIVVTGGMSVGAFPKEVAERLLREIREAINACSKRIANALNKLSLGAK